MKLFFHARSIVPAGLALMFPLCWGCSSHSTDSGNNPTPPTDGGIGADTSLPSDAGNPPRESSPEAMPDVSPEGATDASSDTGPTMATCFPDSPPGNFLKSAGCFDIYESCDSFFPSRYLFVKNGTEDGLTTEQVITFKDHFEGSLFDSPVTLMSAVTASCCDGSTNEDCWLVVYRVNGGQSLEGAAEQLSSIEGLCEAPECLGITVEVPPPR